MATKRNIEIFSAGCSVCDEAVSLVKNMVCPLCEITVSDMNTGDVAERAKALGIRSVPAVVIDGRLVECCTGRGIDEASLRAAGIGQTP